jgi:predicted RNase H-like nuclease (RuvC/YqgF family)
MKALIDPSRRNVLRVTSAAVGAFFLRAASSAAQSSKTTEAPQESGAARRNRDEMEPPIPEAATKKAQLEQRQKDIKKDIEKLFDLATQLKAEVEKTDATATLSMALVHRAEEVEKLAHQIKENAKG